MLRRWFASDRFTGPSTRTIGTRFEQDQAGAVPLPEHAFDACVSEVRHVDKYQTVMFDNCSYARGEYVLNPLHYLAILG